MANVMCRASGLGQVGPKKILGVLVGAQVVESDEGSSEDRWRVEATQDGSRHDSVDALSDSGVETVVVGREDPASEHDLNFFRRDAESSGCGHDEGNDFVGQHVGRLTSHHISLRRRRKEDGGQLKETAVVELAAVDSGEDSFCIGHVEVRRDERA